MQPISQEALRKAQAGDETAIAALIARLMPLIRKSARQNLAPGLDLEDAVQEGLIGLFEALRRYDADRGAPFVPFAAACIRHAQQDARRAASPLERAALLASLDGRSAADTARAMGCTPKAVENALARARRKLRAAAP